MGRDKSQNKGKKKRKRRLGFATVGVLVAIREDHRYGLDIVDHTQLSAGTVYPTLGRLEDRGFIKGTWERPSLAEAEGRPRRRYYELTADGADALDAALESVRSLSSGGAQVRPT